MSIRNHKSDNLLVLELIKIPADPDNIPTVDKVNDRYHNAYMIHNETLYCDKKEEWRGDYSCLKVRLHFTRDKGFYYTTVFAPGFLLNLFLIFPVPEFVGFLPDFLELFYL